MIEEQHVIDFSKIPETKGLGRGTMVLLITGILTIFCIGGAVVTLSGYGHLWPSVKTTRLPLGKMPSQNP